MGKLGSLLVAVALLHTGCDDDDDDFGDDFDDVIEEGLPPDAPADDTTGRVFQVVLTTAEEVPLCAAAGFYATGAATVTLTGDESMGNVGGLRYSELSSAATAAHIHYGPPGVAGPIIIDLTRALTTPNTSITFSAFDYPSPPPAGAPANFATFIDEMLAGNTYINLHTVSCPTGEIRGQLR